MTFSLINTNATFHLYRSIRTPVSLHTKSERYIKNKRMFENHGKRLMKHASLLLSVSL